ncbi:hypothetical protein [Sphingosinicella sp. YJ22]|uniref:hypothetical protein n=1 Tax=Sphingosinicella sp. YJ22 TaxID=1104780 RepID=UPI00140CC2C6|nr:hypothetical protein [Sphingosinicella sp. YJ22]
MKSILFGATALLLSGSAMAASAPTVATYNMGTYSWTAAPQLAQAAWTGAMTYDEAAAWTADKPMALTDAQIAEKEAWVAANPMAASTDVAAKLDNKPMESADGQGGPYEPVANANMSSWPACDPGPGDDRCIQLYEPGVRGAYAQWSAGRERMAMGGPYEPVTSDKAAVGAEPTTEPTGVRVAKADMAMDHANMVSDTRTAEEMQNASVYGKVDETHTGVGGPLEEVRDYPRCRSRSDDRCQQGS